MSDQSPMPVNRAAAAAMWERYLDTLPAAERSAMAERGYEAEQFGDHAALADELVDLIHRGVKTATCSAACAWAYEDEPWPEPGSMSVVLDGRGEPVCIIETTEVFRSTYDAIDAEFARAEGERDRTLESWRAGHRDFFERVLPTMGFAFREDLELVCERFRLVYSG